MSGTSNTTNQGLAHLALRAGGRPLCGTKRAHISVPLSDWDNWPGHCAKCQAIVDRGAEQSA